MIKQFRGLRDSTKHLNCVYMSDPYIFFLQRYKFRGQHNKSRSSKNMNILACYVLEQPAGHVSAIFLSAVSGIFFKQHTCITDYCEGRRQDMNFLLEFEKTTTNLYKRTKNENLKNPDCIKTL